MEMSFARKFRPTRGARRQPSVTELAFKAQSSNGQWLNNDSKKYFIRKTTNLRLVSAIYLKREFNSLSDYIDCDTSAAGSASGRC